MAQHDYVINNQSAPNARSDINNVLQAILTHNSGATAPATMVANMIWYDTSTDLLKIRNEANSGWITLGTVDQTNNIFTPNTGFTPVEQGGGTGMLTNKVRLGWDGTDFRINIDGTDAGRVIRNIAGSAGNNGQITAPGSASLYACRAWVNFNGTGTVAIRGSGNVTSITDNGVGDYTVNFTTAMIDINYGYSLSGSLTNSTANSNRSCFVVIARNTTSMNIASQSNQTNNNGDSIENSVSIFR